MMSEGETVSSFAGGVYCHKSVSFSGSASDNNKVSKIYTQLKWTTDGTDFSDYKLASFDSSKSTDWSLSFTFEKEGVAILKFVAADLT